MANAHAMVCSRTGAAWWLIQAQKLCCTQGMRDSTASAAQEVKLPKSNLGKGAWCSFRRRIVTEARKSQRLPSYVRTGQYLDHGSGV
jgi:hypothetical protein